MEHHTCPLCRQSVSTLCLTKPDGRTYWDCSSCGLIFLDPAFHLASSLEQAQYETHNNDVLDPRYQQFLSPITQYIEQNLPSGSHGLDFGAGPGPVVKHVLEGRGYRVSLFDPFFWNEPQVLSSQYDFVVASEVVEHFYKPYDEFRKLRELLRPGKPLLIMTLIFDDQQDFSKWHYHIDPTHVCFYRWKTLELICEHFKFSFLEQLPPRTAILWS